MQHREADFFGPVVYGYSRAQAIADGVLVDVSTMAKEAGFKIPVAVTEAVWRSYVEWNDEDNKKQGHQDTQGRLWDVLMMLRFAINKNCKTGQMNYKLMVIPRDGKSRRPKLTELKSIMDGGDNGGPVITIMLPSED